MLTKKKQNAICVTNIKKKLTIWLGFWSNFAAFDSTVTHALFWYKDIYRENNYNSTAFIPNI